LQISTTAEPFKAICDLLLEIDRRFRDLDIEIPFPQSDLHVRSIDESAAASVVNQDFQPSKPDTSADR
jgi:small-conductance mechanosensitive channel